MQHRHAQLSCNSLNLVETAVIIQKHRTHTRLYLNYYISAVVYKTPVIQLHNHITPPHEKQCGISGVRACVRACVRVYIYIEREERFSCTNSRASKLLPWQTQRTCCRHILVPYRSGSAITPDHFECIQRGFHWLSMLYHC